MTGLKEPWICEIFKFTSAQVIERKRFRRTQRWTPMLGLSWVKPTWVCQTAFEQVRPSCPSVGHAPCKTPEKKPLIFTLFPHQACWEEEWGCGFPLPLHTIPLYWKKLAFAPFHHQQTPRFLIKLSLRTIPAVAGCQHSVTGRSF